MSDIEEIVDDEVKEKKEEVEFLTFNPSQMIKIVSSDGFEFFIDKRCAKYSKTISNMLSGDYKEKQENTIQFDNLDSKILEKVFQYFYFKQRYDNDSVN